MVVLSIWFDADTARIADYTSSDARLIPLIGKWIREVCYPTPGTRASVLVMAQGLGRRLFDAGERDIGETLFNMESPHMVTAKYDLRDLKQA